MTENLFEESLLLSGLHCSLYRQQQGLLDIGRGKMLNTISAFHTFVIFFLFQDVPLHRVFGPLRPPPRRRLRRFPLSRARHQPDTTPLL